MQKKTVKISNRQIIGLYNDLKSMKFEKPTGKAITFRSRNMLAIESAAFSIHEASKIQDATLSQREKNMEEELRDALNKLEVMMKTDEPGAIKLDVDFNADIRSRYSDVLEERKRVLADYTETLKQEQEIDVFVSDESILDSVKLDEKESLDFISILVE